MKAMAAAVLWGVRDLRHELRPVPSPGANEVLVQVGVVGICGSDLHYFGEGHSGESYIAKPTVIGHEFGGTIVEVGAAVDPNRRGQRVSIEPGQACGTCRFCRSGSYNLCTRMHFLGAAPIDGALQEFVVVPKETAFPIPEEVSDVAAALVEPLSVALWACERAGISPSDSVLVTGAGPVGLLVAEVAKMRGAARVTVVERNPARREFAEQTGVALVLSDVELAEGDQHFDVLVECSGAPAAFDAGLDRISAGGRAMIVGVGPDHVEVPLAIVQEREVTVQGSFRYRHTWPIAISLLAEGRIRVDHLVTHRFSLAQAEDALTINRSDPSAMKVVVIVSAGDGAES